ncbi:MAG: glycosyltransferase [Cyclobacteriaceae bacterium]|nr:glycosyltransferase [Cyclobacteriaceae bacterium]
MNWSSIKGKITKKQIEQTLLLEVSWEACNQVGGIYTVLRSKAPTATREFGDNYCLVGPFLDQKILEFEQLDDQSDNPFARAAATMRELGFDVRYGKWLVTGRPNIVLINPFSVYQKLGEIKHMLWQHHAIPTPGDDELINRVVAFGSLVKVFFNVLCNENNNEKKIIGHFHEWMAGVAIPDMRLENLPVSIVFTTHATLLGRYLAMNDGDFYGHLPFYDWEKESNYFNISSQIKIERAAAHGSHVFTTVSEVTARECKYLIGREVDEVTPNGINIERFTALHELQNLHQEYKNSIHHWVMAHFFPSYSFDLNETLYLFTSGRFEYRNKGFDLTLEALARLNYRMQKDDIRKTVVMFFITKQPYHSVNPEVLQSHALMNELKQTCKSIEAQVGNRLFYAAAGIPDNKLPNLSDYVDDYWRLRFRRTLQSWKSDKLPPVVTHNLIDDHKDPILNFLRTSNMVNHKHDRVKIIYHPDFITPSNPMTSLDYNQFVRGCHLGVFPSYYEPWGYTPLECLASGVPSVTSDLAGFGNYVNEHINDSRDRGIFVVDRTHQDFDKAATQLANDLYSFVKLDRRQRIEMRNNSEATSVFFDWNHLNQFYLRSYNLALKRS